jgi:hypothetical protein
MALVELARRNLLKFVVSQNTDGLHLRSGLPPNILAELHGNSNLETCRTCHTKYLRDFRTRTASRVHDHATTRKCTKCQSTLFDSIINFGEDLPEHELRTSFEHAEQADVCLVLGSSLRVTPAAEVPKIVGEHAGKLAIGNLQSTPLARLAQLNVHAMCDDIMKRVMHKLDMPIPEWELHRRVRVIIGQRQVTVVGLDPNQDIVYTLFSSIRILVRHGTNTKFTSTPINDEQPMTCDIDVPDWNETMNVDIELNWQGHYNEPMYTVRLPALPTTRDIHLFFNAKTGVWRDQ